MNSPPPKRVPVLTNAVTASPVQYPEPNTVVYEGWVLKKRRKKMQGFARRYFVLFQSGLLCYSFEPGKPFRDQVIVPQAAISTIRGAKDIHVDTNQATFHIKCLNTEDFDGWMAAFRQFMAPPADGRLLSRRSSVGRAGSRMSQTNKAAVMLEELGVTLTELENAVEAWQQADVKKAQRVPSASKLKAEKDKVKEAAKESGSKFGLFRKSHSAGHHSPPEPAPSEEKLPTPIETSSPPYNRVKAALAVLRSQHAVLANLIPNLDSNPPTVHGSPLASTAEEAHDRSATPTRNNRWGSVGRVGGARASLAPSISDSGSIWYDAEEAPEGAMEFLIDENPTPDTQEGTESRLMAGSSASDSHSSDYDSGEERDLETDGTDPESTLSAQDVPRRTQLPSGPVGDEGSLFAVLKKNVGKDLSNISFPVSFNEPLTLLQRAAEEVEYYDLLTEAARTEDPNLRLCYVAAFAVSGYNHTRHRSSRKGFNPLLGETFEDPRLKLVAEKVSHHPVILAYHAQSEDWELYATTSGKTKFWGKSLEIIPLGSNHVKIGQDHFRWKKPSSFMRNLMLGTKYLEHSGNMVIENLTTKARCVVEFKENGYWGAQNEVHGTVFAPSGEAAATLEGKWDEAVARKTSASHYQVLWRAAPFPKDAPQYYGFTAWGITLNEITRDLRGRIPPTDSRLRPDVRALEEGDLDTAEHEKERLEEVQRARRRNGQDRQPRWFKQVGDEWVYVGGYWEQRAKGWKDVEPLW
ncbi:hypothetical protein FA95DRAFT_1558038 [Auriscalpium vulgare]|uniref:Uncharacterized protein n=1 Tax=Auriscalpium vulgare TaxID=40419 RepID=A0ACB8RWV4_9AGAM|nr:hypothetical protein FA95DRAFT_1558038 [Auriscalpium vulgare]